MPATQEIAISFVLFASRVFIPPPAASCTHVAHTRSEKVVDTHAAMHLVRHAQVTSARFGALKCMGVHIFAAILSRNE